MGTPLNVPLLFYLIGVYSPLALTVTLLLSDLRHEIPHLFGGFLLRLPCGMGVGAEGKPAS